MIPLKTVFLPTKKMETKAVSTCPSCQKRKQEHRESEEFNFAILIALMPVLTLSLFSVIGLV